MSAEVSQELGDGQSFSQISYGCDGSSARSPRLHQCADLAAITTGGHDEDGGHIGDAKAEPCTELNCGRDVDSKDTLCSQQHTVGRGRPELVACTMAWAAEEGRQQFARPVRFTSANSIAAAAAATAATVAAAATEAAAVATEAARTCGGDDERCPGAAGGDCHVDLLGTPAARTAAVTSLSCQQEETVAAVAAPAEHVMHSIVEEPAGSPDCFDVDRKDGEGTLPLAGQEQQACGDGAELHERDFHLAQGGAASGEKRKVSSLNELETLKRLTARLGLSTRRPSYTAWLQSLGAGRFQLQLVATAAAAGLSSSSDSDGGRKLTRRNAAAGTADGDLDWSPDGGSGESGICSDHEESAPVAACASESIAPADDVQKTIARVERSLQDLRTELVKMQATDQALAQRFISLRHDVQELRLRRAQLHYEDLLDEAAARTQLTGSRGGRSDELLANDDMPPLLRGRLESSVDSSGVAGCDGDARGDPDDRISQLTSIGITKMNLMERRFSVF